MSTPCVKGGMKLSEALDSMQLAYNPITKQLHFVSPKVQKKSPDEVDSGSLSKKGSFSDEGNFSISTCEKSDSSDSPKSTLLWSGHRRGKDGGSFSSTVSSLSEYSLSGGYASKDEEDPSAAPGPEDNRGTNQDSCKFKKKGLSSFFSRGVFPWKSSGSVAAHKNQDAPSVGVTWRLFGSKSSNNLANVANKALAPETQGALPTPGSSGANTPHHHKRQGSSASEKQFEDLVASSIALIQHDRPSNLPAKCSEEALRHRAEHARMVEAARKRGEREAAARRMRLHEALKQEETFTRHAREWTTTVLNNWDNMKSSKRTLELWWSGLPPCVRGKVWQLAIDNKLNITLDMYHDCVIRAKQKLKEAQLRRKRLKINRINGCKDCKSNCETHKTGNDNQESGNEEKKDTICNGTDESRIQSQHSTDRISGKNFDEKLNRLSDCDRLSPKPEYEKRSALPNSKWEDDKRLSPSPNSKLEDDKGLSPSLNSKSEDEKRLSPSPNSKSEDEKRLSPSPNSKSEDEKRLSVTLNGMHRNLSEQNLKSHCIDVAPSKQNSKSNPNLLDYGDECSMELIQLDIARTFPHLCIFQPGGPYFDVLHELLAAYVCYRPDIGYVQGMSFIGAMLILNMEAPQAFVCFANLLDGPVLKAAFTRDGATMQRLWNAYAALLNYNLPALAGRIAPELYLLEWIYTAFAKAMPLDAACRVWDLFLRDGDTFLFRSALGVLHLYQEQLKEMDFISAAQFLTKLPEDLSSDALFRSISCISMTLDGLSFEELVDCCEVGEHVLDECQVERL